MNKQGADIRKTITVVGEFDYYKEDYATYCQLLNAEMEVDKSLSW